MSRQRPRGIRQFGAEYCKRGCIRGALRADHEIDGRQIVEHIAPEDLTQAPAEAIARHRR